jgi:hypothetical protein
MDMFGGSQSPNIGTSSGSGGFDMSSILQMLMKSQQTPLQGIASAIPGVQFASNMGKYQQPANRLAASMTDLNNPLYQQLYGQFKQQGQQNIAQNLQMMEGRNRTLSAMGRTPLFSPERGGEEVFRQMMMGNQDAQNNASQQALGQIQNAYSAARQQGAANMQTGQTKANVNSSLLGALTSPGIMKYFLG